MNIQWDARGYTDRFSFVHHYGGALLELIGLDGSALDLGCGNGALTAELAERGLQVVGLDASRELLEIARANHPELMFRWGDATDFDLPEPVDVVFSNAVLHWIDAEKQPDVLKNVHRALKDGGEFVFEMGGKGNNAKIHGALAEAFARRGLAYRMPFYFPSIGEYVMLLEKAGFRVEYAVLFERPTELCGEDGLADWIRMFVKTPFDGVDGVEEIVSEAVEALRDELFQDGKWYADYVRLRMKAVK